MSEIVIAGNTSGSVTIAAPDVAGTTTLTLPASSGTVLDDASVGVCRAWVNFNGTGTVAIMAAFNVSSITDNGTGFYTVNIATALADSNYSVVGTSNQGGAIYIVRTAIATKTTTACDLSHNSTTAAVDGIISVAIFR